MAHVLDEDGLDSVCHSGLFEGPLELVGTSLLLLRIIVAPSEVESGEEGYDEEGIGEEE